MRMHSVRAAIISPTVIMVMFVVGFLACNQQGISWRFAEHESRVSLVTFLYTYAADVCPFVSTSMQPSVSILGEKGGENRLVAISADQLRDTLPVLTASRLASKTSHSDLAKALDARLP